VLRAVRHADLLERVHHAFLPLGRLHTAVGERKLDVLIHIQIADEIETLKDESNLAVTNASALGERQVRHGLPVERVLAFGG
jgi:hypothetical protein